MNEETRIAIDCALKSGGQPYLWAGCTATQLTIRELTKCFTGRFGEDCFGPTNTIVVGFRNAFKDLTQGLGESNDIVQAGKKIEDAFRQNWEAAARENGDVARFIRGSGSFKESGR